MVVFSMWHGSQNTDLSCHVPISAFCCINETIKLRTRVAHTERGLLLSNNTEFGSGRLDMLVVSEFDHVVTGVSRLDIGDDQTVDMALVSHTQSTTAQQLPVAVFPPGEHSYWSFITTHYIETTALLVVGIDGGPEREMVQNRPSIPTVRFRQGRYSTST